MSHVCVLILPRSFLAEPTSSESGVLVTPSMSDIVIIQDDSCKEEKAEWAYTVVWYQVTSVLTFRHMTNDMLIESEGFVHCDPASKFVGKSVRYFSSRSQLDISSG